jgi:hypothetical protein
VGTISCPGGHSFSDGLIPCPNEYYLIPDLVIEELVAKIIATVKADEDIDARVGYLITSTGTTTYKCPICSRLIVFWNEDFKHGTSYKLES